ncbi:MAG: phospholipase D-like domain-containing protein [Bacteroidota bacterium]|nr:phospholipase D-like domain-containing protein [Bacteroidota bacterium]
MRFKSTKTNGYTLYAITGTNTVSFAIDFRDANTKNLLGFAVERIDKRNGTRKFIEGYKVFKQLIAEPNEDTEVSTYTHPVQSFVWDDFTCFGDTEYDYFFCPLKGTPKNIDRTERKISITVKTEKIFSDTAHDIFFNRGVASSQAYRRKFFNLPPDKIKTISGDMYLRALGWLSRQLDDALLDFIKQAKPGDTLLGCFYEFHYQPVVQAFREALDRGVKVQLIIDAKVNESTDKKGKFHESFPREKNLAILKTAGISLKKSDKIVFQRTAKANDIQHNKFIVYVSQAEGNMPMQVWTGSTNISMGGIHGQTNVGHWVRNKKTAELYKKYWDILSKDPGGKDGDDGATVRKKNEAFKKEVMQLQDDIEFTDWDDIPVGITPIFSPRKGAAMLTTYVKMMDAAKDSSCITLAFGINKLFKDYLLDNTDKHHISFLLLEKQDKPNKRSKQPFVKIGAGQNVYQAWGSYIQDKLYQWAAETSARHLGLNTHVVYIHSKFLLVDPLGDDPVLVSGSANFSEASTTGNDENMIIIRGNLRAADIYFTEFNRLFNHYYFRAVYSNAKNNRASKDANIFLQPNDSWLEKYKRGKYRYKRVDMFSKMKGFTTL